MPILYLINTRCPFRKYTASSCSLGSFPRKRESRRRTPWGLDARLRGHDVILVPDLRNRHRACCVADVIGPDEVSIVRYVHALTDDHRALLAQTMQAETSFRTRARAPSLLLSDHGTPIKDIAKTSHVDRDTVSRWITNWEHHGAQSRHDKPRSGRPSKLTLEAQALAHQDIKEEPRALTGVGERLATKTAKRISIASLKRLAKKARLRWKRVRKSFKRCREPAACARCQRELAALPQQADTGKIDLYYFDDSGFALDPSLPYAWQAPGSVIELPAMQYGRINVLGCMHRHNDLHSYMFEHSIPTGVVIACFDAFCPTITQKTVVIMDNASIHTSEAFEHRMPYWKKQG
jgi:transposase